ncbi:hypothetical protein ACVVIH_12105 [Chryseobacterium arthrosphaerae]|uniref:hypothetical protein n=1 Tax=Chryseobacterium arthrosphaerae TaxID=651561 RepID=UPI003D3473F6
MKNTPDETDFFSGKNLTRFIVVFAIFIIILLSYIYIASHLNWGFNMGDKNQIGDAIGGISAPFIGISTCILTFIAFYVQYDFNKKQSVFIKQQQINEFISEFNQTFNLITIPYILTDILHVMPINETVKKIIQNPSEEDILSIKKENNCLNPILNILNSNRQFIISNNIFSYYDPCRKFLIFVDLLVKEFSRLELNESEKINIAKDFIIKFEIVTTPEIINFLTLTLISVPNNVIKNKDFIIKSLKQHYGVDKAIFNIYEQIQNNR